MDSVRGPIQEWWQGLAQWQKIAAVGLSVGTVALLFYLTMLAQTPEYAVAYSGLSQQDAASIVDALKKNSVPYLLEADGSTIRVPANQVHQIRLDIASQGLPKGGVVGFEIFDGGQLGALGMTDFLQRVNYQRALEGELARTIGSLDPLQGARVHIVIPEQSLFLDEQKNPTASVLVEMKPGRRLDAGQIQAVTNLVSSSVEGLKPANVTIVDVEGTVLSIAGTDETTPGLADVTATQIEIQRMMETETQTRLQRLLDQTLGPDKSAVQVSVAMDWDRLETSSETYTPGAQTGVVRSSRVTEEYDGTGNALNGGIPGTDSNSAQVPTYQTVISDTAQGGALKRESLYNYEVSKTTQNLVKSPGGIKRMSVALMLDESVPVEQRQSIQEMVAAAAGVDTARGDTIALAATTFDRSFYTQQAESLAASQRQELLVTGVKALGSVVGLVVLLLFVRSLFRDITARRMYPHMTVLPQGQAAMALPAGAMATQLPGGEAVAALAAGAAPSGNLLSQAAAAAAAAREEEEAADELDISSLRQPPTDDARYLRHLTALTRDDPDTIVEVIEGWLREE
jgi:flagellar M-ring protein FliF